jgi:hypothetical protein
MRRDSHGSWLEGAHRAPRDRRELLTRRPNRSQRDAEPQPDLREAAIFFEKPVSDDSRDGQGMRPESDRPLRGTTTSPEPPKDKFGVDGQSGYVKFAIFDATTSRRAPVKGDRAMAAGLPLPSDHNR